jgi:hypothetical protein
MLAFTSTSKTSRAFALLVLFLLVSAPLRNAHAEEPFGQAPTPGKSEEEDFGSTPYEEYGEFNEDEDEAANAQFLQYGRFFGASVGFGSHGSTGNRGSLWDGGFPAFDFKLHYWFNFNFALQMGYTTAPHFFTANGDRTDVRFNRVGLDLKYYFDTRDLSSSITFAGPYVLLGAGNFTKSQTNIRTNVIDNDSSLGMTFGAGLEFTVSPKKVYFFLQGTYDMATFKDTNTEEYQASNGLDDMSGGFYTFLGGVLFTW